MITVLVADDHALIRSGLAGMLGAQPDLTIVGAAADGAEAVRMAAELSPDVVVMDIRMPTLDGIEATRRIRAAAEAPAVLVLTTFDLDEYVYDALRAGAGGFLLKDAPPGQLAEAVRTVAAGDSLLAPAVTRRLITRFLRVPPSAAATAAAADRLTERELEVLRLIARGQSNTEIAARLFLSDATVKTHVSRVLTKLGLRDRVQAVVYAYENGLVTPGEDET
ncbi:response regulator [Paractinoplanes brasiliensis]|uniref:LuxR family two component transcriptional regulator n=1 Tax=Paractinoplanes brasiliensis TaxID=52695 RepID=A0A4R6J8N3_9ACTN|nr:response regulator transcription factor [Actinoplanes brasiliensis]TDO31822.1 LuxR family two component transcriptional regulator [Actinoplanes brasiliensis]GID30580.1 DNA-binding response regulator [Actinoplanes brasiliensis]